MAAPVLYFGDGSAGSAAAYLAGVMQHAGIPFDYLASDRSPQPGLLEGPWRLLILSDYPAGNLTTPQLQDLEASVRAGCGLLMIGGWDSFQGLGGKYAGTPLSEALPVALSAQDDRCNWSFPCLAVARQPAAHPILAGLPWRQPPVLGGLNLVRLKPGAQLLLEAVRFRTSLAADGAIELQEVGRDPLLAVWSLAAGRAAAFAGDAAPHWVGGFVDWGQRRIRAGSGAAEVEVGEHYARFFENLIRWTGRL